MGRVYIKISRMSKQKAGSAMFLSDLGLGAMAWGVDQLVHTVRYHTIPQRVYHIHVEWSADSLARLYHA